ncbi:hypothetical protein J4H86_05620 [Spiractinospora alimapuensis]|uniref:hypothetical protein n=1 Tax=Spiractinospora alimapuensis TaxID=2820884 RepID=UPI001F160348|nr:hypothetical protein [Spiractinospora alimapuensis]QVQ53256.1 hypothetical protein J4H86_05620 [Spiractinospora alimapuensis]
MRGFDDTRELEERIRAQRTPGQWKALWVSFVGFTIVSASVPVVLILALRDRLPDPMATRVGSGGDPSSSMSVTANLIGLPLITVLTLGMLTAIFSPRLARLSTSKSVPPVGLVGAFNAGTGGLLTGAWCGIVHTNLDVAGWTETQAGAEIWVYMVTGALLGGLLGWCGDRALSVRGVRGRGGPDQRPAPQ